MYDPILAKSFSRYDRKRFGFLALILCFVIALSICSSFKPRLHHLSFMIGDAVNLQLMSINAAEDMQLLMDDMSDNSESTGKNDSVINNATILDKPMIDVMLQANDTNPILQPTAIETKRMKPLLEPTVNNHAPILQKPIDASQNTLQANDTNAISQPIVIDTMKTKPLCRILESNADYCEIEGDIRIDANSSTVFLVRPRLDNIISDVKTWIIQPYPRKGIPFVKNWTVTSTTRDDESVPKCTKIHNLTAILFSISGYSGNHFHDMADLLVPLYTTSFNLKRQVHFLASDFKPWWPLKFRALLNRLTKHDLVDIDREKQVLCYNKVIAGLNFHKELVIHPSSPISIQQFRQFLRETYSLERTEVVHRTKKGTARPRLMIVSRKRTRILTNEDEVSRVAKKLGYEVVLAEMNTSTNMENFAREVNSCDVLMGIHGAGLTNMVFLPNNAVLIQVVPLGAIEVFARLDFGDPAKGMEIKYLEYKIGIKESSLSQSYPSDHPVLRDPMSFHRKGWGELRAVYLNNQNVTIDVRRFKATLTKALKLLQR